MLSIEEHLERAEKLRQEVKRVVIEVRDAQEIWGMKSSSHAHKELRELVELGYIEYEPPKKGQKNGKFYLP